VPSAPYWLHFDSSHPNALELITAIEEDERLMAIILPVPDFPV
jgi:hypothetical protein